jgi:hypothetical protein
MINEQGELTVVENLARALGDNSNAKANRLKSKGFKPGAWKNKKPFKGLCFQN